MAKPGRPLQLHRHRRALTSTTTLSITVTGLNDGPVAIDDRATTPEGTPVTVAVLNNDSDPDGDPLTVTQINGPPITVGRR